MTIVTRPLAYWPVLRMLDWAPQPVTCLPTRSSTIAFPFPKLRMKPPTTFMELQPPLPCLELMLTDLYSPSRGQPLRNGSINCLPRPPPSPLFLHLPPPTQPPSRST